MVFSMTVLPRSSLDDPFCHRIFPGYLSYLSKLSSQNHRINLAVEGKSVSSTIRHSNLDVEHVLMLRRLCSQ